MNEEDAQTAALQEYFDSNAPAGYGAAFRAGWDAGRIHEVGGCTHGRESDAALETAESVAQMAAHDRDEALENFARVEQEYERLRQAAHPIYHFAHEEHAHVRLGDDAHDPDCLLCEQIDELYMLIRE